MLVELIEVMRKTERSREKIVRMPHMEQVAEVEEIYEVLNSGEPERDLESIMQKIMNMREDSFFMEEVWGETKEDRVKLLKDDEINSHLNYVRFPGLVAYIAAFVLIGNYLPTVFYHSIRLTRQAISF